MKPKLISAAIAAAVLAITPQASLAATFNVVGDFNDTGVQPAPGNPHTFPFTCGTETTLGAGFALLPYFGNTSCSVAGGNCTTSGTVNNYYFAQQFSGPKLQK